jgi:hypothetical protein
MTEEIRYVPLGEVGLYRAQGWTVVALPAPHGCHSALAVRAAPTLKALSIRAPWWWFILHGGKDVENRSWSTKYRGPVLIHASKWFNRKEIRDDFLDARGIAEAAGRQLPGSVTLRDLRASGGHIVGCATIVDCVTRSDSPWFFGPDGFVLADPVPFAAPIPCKGALGLFDVSQSILEMEA